MYIFLEINLIKKSQKVFCTVFDAKQSHIYTIRSDCEIMRTQKIYVNAYAL